MTLDNPSERLARFHDVLVDELRRTRPGRLGEPFTVADIYQQLVPYSTHRDRLGIEMNADYEDVLLRLLAGEGDFLEVESEHARERLEEEVRSSNPDTGLFREYAAVDVRLNEARVPESVADARGSIPVDELAPTPDPEEVDLEPGGADDVPEAGDAGVGTPTAPTGNGSETHSGETEEDDRTSSSVEAAGSDELPEACPWCREELPARKNLTYCPFCGTDVRLQPCVKCGETLEPGWLFCIACGTEVGSS